MIRPDVGQVAEFCEKATIAARQPRRTPVPRVFEEMYP